MSSLFVSMVLIPPLIKSAGRFQIIDQPGGRKLHPVPVARVGGIAFAIAAMISILIWNPKDPMVVSYLIGSLIILICGVWDDWVTLDFKIKFLAQTAAALVVVLFGHVRLNTFPFMDGIVLPDWLAIPFTIIALLGITNAINLSDGLDGLAGGLCLLSFGGLSYLAYLGKDPSVLGMVISVLGGVFGFMRFNTYPARVFMGDGGSQFLGFTMGALAFILTDPSRGPYSPTIGLLLVGLPLLDTLCVMIQRVRKGSSPFIADRNHLHHKLLAAGFFHHEAVIIIYSFQIVMVTLACLLRWQDDGTVLIFYGVISLLVFSLFFLMGRGYLVWRRDRNRSGSLALLNRIQSSRWLTEAPIQLLELFLPLFVMVIVFVPRKIPFDFGNLSLGLLILSLAGFFIFQKANLFWIRLAFYVGGAFGIYLCEETLFNAGWPGRLFFNLFFILLAGVVVAAIWTNKGEPFQTTPLDYLIALIVLIVPLVMKLQVGGIALGELVAKMIILFYAYELLLSRFARHLKFIGSISFWILLMFGLRAWAF
ncbi:MAG: glycosyltransferase family 4 protein [Nitrospiria bacterium]